MAHSYTTYTGNGVDIDYTLPFPYLDVTHIHVYLDGVETEAFTWVNSSTIRFDSVPTAGQTIRISRQTNHETQIVDYNSGALLTEEDLDSMFDQLFYIAQEMEDAFDYDLLAADVDATEAAKVAAEASKVAAEAAEDKAEKWADEVEGVEVETGKYSSKHWAAKAEDSALSITTHDHIGGDGAAITEAALSLSDVTTGNVSTAKHGFVPKAPNDTSKVLVGDGTWGETGGVPVGCIIVVATPTVPTGFLECDGSSLLKTSYTNLYTTLKAGGASCVYGEADVDHFNLPDYRGQFLRGWDHGAAIDPDKASRTDRGDGTGGDVVGSKQADELKSHTHSVTHIFTYYGSGYSPNSGAGWSINPGIESQATGGNETRPKNINVMYCIKY